MKDIFSHNEIVSKENYNLQRGMNFRPQGKKYSIFLMCVKDNALYNDGFDKDGKILIYEGEDVSKRGGGSVLKIMTSLFYKDWRTNK